jgi:hypothetical protein
MHLLLSDVLAPWGQAAAIILAIFLFVNILIGLVFTAAFAFLFAWVREKAELLKKIRPNIDIVNKAIETPESVFPVGDTQQKLVQVVQRVQAIEVPQKLEQVQHQVSSVSAQVDKGADRVAETMIEIRARTEMVKGFLKAFFLPGLTDRRSIEARPRALLPEGVSEGTETLAAEPGSEDGGVKQLVEAGHGRPR